MIDEFETAARELSETMLSLACRVFDLHFNGHQSYPETFKDHSTELIASALRSQREKGREEMREMAAKICDARYPKESATNQYWGMKEIAAKQLSNEIRALPAGAD